MRKIMMVFLLIMLWGTRVMGQIPQEVMDVMKKCGTVMDSPKGMEMTMDVKLSYLVFTVKMQMVTSEKGGMSMSKMTSTMLGQTMTEIHGFDGKQEWKYSSSHGKKEGSAKRDTLYITQTTQKSDGENDVDFDLYNEYGKAKMKVGDKFYEIVFTEPKNKDVPKKSTMYIVKDTYRFHGMEFKESGAKVKIKVTKIKYGVDDKVFELRLEDFPNAVVVRKN